MRKRVKATTSFHFDAGCQNAKGSKIGFKRTRIKRNGVGNTKVARNKKTRSWATIGMKSEVLEGKVIVHLPIRTKSEANTFERWQVKHARHKEQQRIVALGLNPLKPNIRLPCRIFLTRFAPDELDVFDNLPVSFKYIVDAICAIITGEYRAGKADSDKRISIACGQEKSDAYGIKIEIAWD